MARRAQVLLLFGGGLDGRLACELLSRAGADVTCVHLDTAFVDDGRRAHVDACVRAGRFPLEVVPVFGDYLNDVVLADGRGYGRATGTCLDCRTFFLRKAGEIARARGIEWLATGEVVGQRALDQSHAALVRAERDADVVGRVLRPLSAGLLPDAPLPLDRSVRLHGRTRRGQIDLATRLGLVDAPPPRVGCCRLADPRFGARLRDLLAHRDPAAIARDDVERLAHGRHLRLGWNVKVVVGRNEAECRWLEQRSGADAIARAADRRGALAIVEGAPDDANLMQAASIVARYSARCRSGPVEVAVRGPDLSERRLAVHPAADAWIEARRI